MFYIVLFFLATIVNSFLQDIPDAKASKIRQLDIRTHIEFFFEDETLFTSENGFSIYYDGDWTLYKIQYPFDSSINGKSVKSEIRHYYFVFGKGDREGYRFDPNRPESDTSASVDSILNKFAMGNFTWDQITVFTPVSYYDSATNVLEEIYGPQDPSTTKDTMKFYYSNRFKDYEFSFSKKLDSLKNMKLFKIVVHNGPFYYEKLKKEFPKRESYFMMEEGKETDLEQVKHYFEAYKKMKKKAG